MSTIPQYDGNVNGLSTFIGTINIVNDLLGSIQLPQMNLNQIHIIFVTTRDKVVGKALPNIRGYPDLKDSLIKNFSDKSNSVTILNNILNIQNIKNRQLYFEVIKHKISGLRQKHLSTRKRD